MEGNTGYVDAGQVNQVCPIALVMKAVKVIKDTKLYNEIKFEFDNTLK